MRGLPLAALRVLALVPLLAGCARLNDDPVCQPGARKCVEGAARFCDERGHWSVPEACPASTVCEVGICRSACLDTCIVNERRCSPAGPQTSVGGASGCGEWPPPEACAPGEVCQDGACRADCPIVCQVGQSRCVGESAFVVCDATGTCPQWSEWRSCPPGPEGGIETCTGGVCHAAGGCSDQCRAGEVVCLTEVQSQTCAVSADGCLDWTSPNDCRGPERCRDGVGCGAACEDECVAATTRCIQGGRQRCGAGPEGCTVWGAIEACAGGCVDGECQDVRQPECAAGEHRCGAGGGVQVCEAGACAQWGAETPCPAGEECAGEGECGVREPGASESQGCGQCGQTQRTCTAARQWSDWGACGGEGECTAGAEERCGRCGTRRCGVDCRWGGCEGEGPCETGARENCGNCGTRTGSVKFLVSGS